MTKKQKVEDDFEESDSDNNIAFAETEEGTNIESSAETNTAEKELILPSNNVETFNDAEILKEQRDIDNASINTVNTKSPDPIFEKKDERFKVNSNNAFPSMAKNIKEIKDKIALPTRERRSDLSLLWIVIVIVLIIWLVGWSLGGFGLGSFIHILAIIVLILLILWLLKII